MNKRMKFQANRKNGEQIETETKSVTENVCACAEVKRAIMMMMMVMIGGKTEGTGRDSEKNERGRERHSARVHDVCAFACICLFVSG